MIKYSVISLIILLTAFHARGQMINCDSVYTIVEHMPVYGNGMKDFYSDFGRLKFTKECRPEDLTRVSWIVNKEGQMIDIEVKVLNDQCAPSIVNQLKTFPKWTPAKHGGQNVCVRMTLPVHLRGSR